MQVQPRLVTSGNTRGNVIGPVDKLDWADTSKVWSVPGGPCPVEHEAEAPPRHVDLAMLTWYLSSTMRSGDGSMSLSSSSFCD